MGLVPYYQFRGFRYGLTAGLFVFFCMPVVRRQTFIRRAGISAIPFAMFMYWGYIWGHEHWWRQTYEGIMSFEIGTGARHRFTMK